MPEPETNAFHVIVHGRVQGVGFRYSAAGRAVRLGLSGWEMLMKVGYDADYARGKVNDGFGFKMVVFAEGAQAKPATWDNLIDMVKVVYPHLAQYIEPHRAALKASVYLSSSSRSALFEPCSQPEMRHSVHGCLSASI